MFVRAETMKIAITIVFVCISLVFYTEPLLGADYRCGGDLNGDGQVDPATETQSCTQTPEGYLCPINVQMCTSDQTNPICPQGTSLDPNKDKCVTTPTDGTCRYSGFTFDRTRGVCKKYVGRGFSSCPPQTYKSRDGYCYSCAKTASCPPGTVYKCSFFQTSGWCESTPQCSSGSYDPGLNMCVTPPVCPLGNYPCMSTQGGKYCSPYTCTDVSNPANVEQEEADLTAYQNDGTVDEQGNCSGQFYIFNGSPGECRPRGTQTQFHNCCECETDPQCKPSELTTSCGVTSGRAHYIGEYCKEKWEFIGCVQKARVYCLFSSKLARIVHEQGRPQLKSFGSDGGWGTAKSPNCRGFTPEEFQNLDFSKIDLSEYIGELTQQAGQTVQQLQQGLQNTIQQGIENVQP